MKVIADTGFIVALGSDNDVHHRWATEVAKQVTEPALSCEAVLAETAFQLKSVGYVLALLDRGVLQVAFDFPANLKQLRGLAEKYEDRNPDLADLCLIRMSELYPSHTVLTVDESNFRVYRRNKREVIPILSPRGASGIRD
ncbi:MAG TPA: hypothetical protein VEG30_17120 [Terriglobales bacterium]|nr:hypothetical protein [Terriglobales bacterium]